MRSYGVTRLGCLMVCCLTVATTRAADLDREKLRQQLTKHEGKKSKVYNDSEGIPTIGVGFNLTRSDAKKKIEQLGLDHTKVKEAKQVLTDAQIEKLLEADIDSAIADCKAIFPKFADLSDVRQRVLIDMMFNLGKKRFEQFKKMIQSVEAGKYDAAAEEMKASKWYEQVKVRGKTLEAMMRTGKDPG
jgi:lysozyme